MQAYTQLQNRLKEGYVNVQSGLSYASNVIIPGTPNTKRNHLSDGQKVQLYLDSVKGNPDVDASKIAARETAKIPRIVAKVSPELDFIGPINAGIGKFTKAVEKGFADLGAMALKRHHSEENVSPDYRLEWTAPAGCEQSVNSTWKSTDMVCTWVNQQNKLGSNHVKAQVEIIGDMNEDFPMFEVPTMFDDRMIDLFVEALQTKKPYVFFDSNYNLVQNLHISILATPENCEAINAKLPSNVYVNGCRKLEGLNPVQQIDDFIRDNYLNYRTISRDCGLLISPLLMEEWAKKSKLLRENGLAAIAVRAKDWKAFNYGLIAGGAAAGLLCATGIIVKCRKPIAKTIGDAGNAIKQVAVKMGCIARDEEEEISEDSADAIIEMTATGTGTAEVKSNGKDLEESSVVVSSPDTTTSGDSSSNW